MPHYTCREFPLCYKCYPVNQHHQRFLDAFILRVKTEARAELDEINREARYLRALRHKYVIQKEKYDDKLFILRLKQCIYSEKNRKKTKHEDRVQTRRAERLREVLSEWGLPLPDIDLNLYNLPPIYELFH